jgi:hypothetical protein
MEHGFYHPEQGYWQAISEPSAEILAKYPEGTVRVPLKPGSHFEWLNGEWVSIPKTSEELADEAREQRGMLLNASDKHVLLDRWAAMTLDQQTAWSQYRQALRDLPAQAGFPFEIFWPVKPS